jgi:hypothetical protein
MDLDKIPARVLADLREAGWTDDQIEQWNPQLVFHEWCNWNGLIGWGDTLWEVVEDLQTDEVQS